MDVDRLNKDWVDGAWFYLDLLHHDQEGYALGKM